MDRIIRKYIYIEALFWIVVSSLYSRREDFTSASASRRRVQTSFKIVSSRELRNELKLDKVIDIEIVPDREFNN